MKGMQNGIKFTQALGLLVLSMTFSFTGCTKDIAGNDPGKGDDPSKINPEEAFDFATKHAVQLNISYDVPKGYPVDFEVYAQNPISLNKNKDYVKDTTLRVYATGRTDNNGTASIYWENKPDIIEEIYVYSPQLGVPRVLRADATGKTIEVTDRAENIAVKSTAIQTRAGFDNGSYYSRWPLQDISYRQPLGDWDEDGRPDYLLAEKWEFNPNVQRIIDATLPADGDLNPAGYLREYLHISERANVKLYFYSHNSGRQNVLAYYTYPGDGKNIPSQEYINKNLIVLFPNLNNSVSQGEGVQLKYYDGEKFTDEFPANTNIGWVLLVDAFRDGSIQTNNTKAVYSPKQYNQYNMKNTTMADRPHVGMFKADETFVLAFEDQPWGTGKQGSAVVESYPADLRDDIFIVEANPIRALPDDLPPGIDPEDPDIPGFQIHSPDGVLAFEDLWPQQGDFDMNDVVIRYKMTDYINYDSDISGLEGVFTFAYDGATRANGFGFELNTTVDNIQYVTVESTYKCPGQGLDRSANKAMIMLFDNGKKVPIGTTFYVKVLYKKGVSLLGYKYAPYNPFIIVNCEDLTQGDRDEVHLSKTYAPTEKVNPTTLGTKDDLSDPSKGYYYLSNNNYPFAIDLPEGKDFIGASESTAIDKMYPDFIEWCKSGGKTHKDWFLYPAH